MVECAAFEMRYANLFVSEVRILPPPPHRASTRRVERRVFCYTEQMALPDILNTGFKTDEPMLWKVDIPIEKLPISELQDNLDILYLEQEGTHDWNLSPRMLIENFNKEPFHSKKVDEADLTYPIEIYFHKGVWIILDGVHRFTKAVKLGHDTINVRRVSEEIAQMTKRNK